MQRIHLTEQHPHRISLPCWASTPFSPNSKTPSPACKQNKTKQKKTKPNNRPQAAAETTKAFLKIK